MVESLISVQGMVGVVAEVILLEVGAALVGSSGLRSYLLN
jgi:hypothetical protein